MADDDGEQTWGAQDAAPVDNGSAPEEPHADYRSQAAEHFSDAAATQAVGAEQVSLPVTPSIAPPTVPPLPGQQAVMPVTPAQPVMSVHSVPPQPAAPPSGWTANQWGASAPYAPAPPRVSTPTFVTKLVERGIGGELLKQQPWFHNLRATRPETIVYAGYAIAVVLTILLGFISPRFVSTLLIDATWAALAYAYLAVGTKLAHQFLLWGICVAGAVVMLLKVFGAITMLGVNEWIARSTGSYFESPVLAVLNLLVCVGTGALLVYTGIQLYREIEKLSRPRF